jgi:hypothetical protein
MATFYLDYENGNDANDGTTFANRWKTITSGATAARIAPGDIIRIMASPDPTSLGQAATWTNLSKTVTLTTAVTANIDDCETAWTASANVTATADTTQFKENTKSAKLVIAAAFTTGLAAYRATGTLNLSAYKQVSFWIRNSEAIPNGSSLSLRLCSDTLGAVTVDTIAIPAIPSTNQWVPITIDKAAALGSSIQSVALYVDSDFGAVDIFLDNIIACKDSTSADSLTLTSLIGKNTAGETWFGIQSINGTAVRLDNGVNTLGSAGRGYTGTTETVTTYKRETIKLPMQTSSASVHTVQDSGTPGNVITFSGGWDRTAMSSQSGQTWFDGQNGLGLAVAWTTRSWITLGSVGAVRFNTGFGATTQSSIGIRVSTPGCNNNSVSGIGTNASFVTVEEAYCYNNSSSGISISNGERFRITGPAYCSGNISIGVLLGATTDAICSSVTANNNSTHGVSSSFIIGCLAHFRNGYFASNGTSSVRCDSGIIRLIGCTFTDATEVSSQQAGLNSRVISVNHDATANNHQIFTDGGLISSETSIRKTASGIAWKLSPTSTNRSSAYPLDQVLATVAVAANALVTVKAWLRRTNVALTGSLVVRGGQISGVSADVTASMTAIADTWEEVTLTFTPTAAGVVEIEVWAYGGTTHSLYVDDLTITQA